MPDETTSPEAVPSTETPVKEQSEVSETAGAETATPTEQPEA